MTTTLVAAAAVLLGAILLYALVRFLVKGVIGFVKFVAYGFVLFTVFCAALAAWWVYFR